MHSIRHLCLLVSFLFLAGCAPHFQVFHTKSHQLALDEESKMRYHGDANLDVYYDFWSEGGIMLFYLVNKTDNTLLVDFEKSYVAINKREINYYADQNETARRPYDDPNESAAISTYFHELPRVLEMPPQSGQWIEGYPICFDWFPLKRKTRYQTFPPDKSPLQILHHLTYTFAENETEAQALRHQLWISAIQQMKTREFQTIEQTLPQGIQSTELFYLRNPTNGNGQQAEAWGELTIGLLEVITLFL